MNMILKFIRGSAEFLDQLLVSIIQVNRSWMASRIRQKIYRTSCIIDTNVIITNKSNFESEVGSCLYHSSYILNTNGQFYIGQNSHLGAFCYVNACYGQVIIGRNVAIGPGTKIISYSNHYTKGRLVTEEKRVSDVLIGDNVFIGANCTILPGSVIESNVIVGAGAVVKGRLETNAIFAGVPVRKIKSDWY